MMKAGVRFRTVVHPPRWRFALTSFAVAVGVLSVGGSGLRADQTVYFDGARDASHISLIGDSTLTGVRWYADYGELERFNFVLSAESCRRTIEQSCISREGYRSANVVSAMRTLDGELGDVDGARTGKGEAMKPSFHDDATICGYVGPDLFAGPIQGLYDWNDEKRSGDRGRGPLHQYRCCRHGGERPAGHR